MSGLFYIATIFLVTLITTVVTGFEFHEIASFVALGLSSVTLIISIVNAADLNSLFKAINESIKKVKGETDERRSS